jgi:hypothetical protein
MATRACRVLLRESQIHEKAASPSKTGHENLRQVNATMMSVSAQLNLSSFSPNGWRSEELRLETPFCDSGISS